MISQPADQGEHYAEKARAYLRAQGQVVAPVVPLAQETVKMNGDAKKRSRRAMNEARKYDDIGLPVCPAVAWAIRTREERLRREARGLPKLTYYAKKRK